MYQEDLKMKKVLALALGMLLIPFTAFGMQTMSETDMDSVTGQSGVAISISNVQIYSDGADDLWYETEVEFEGETQAVGILSGNTASFTFVNAIADPAAILDNSIDGTVVDGDGVYNTTLLGESGNLMLRGNYASLGGDDGIFEDAEAAEDVGVRRDAAVLSIRVVDNANSVFPGKANTDMADEDDFAAIEIGLPTMEIYNPEGSFDEINIVVWGGYDSADTNPLSAWTGGDDLYTFGLGTLYTGGESTTALLGGRVGITSYGQIDEAYKTYGFTDAP